MELTKVDKVFKVYEKVKVLDAEIIELDKVAMQLANDDTDVCLDFKITNFTPKKEEESTTIGLQSIFESYKRELSFSSLWGQPTSTTPEQNSNNNTTVFNHQVSTNNALKILGLLLSDKLEKRERLLTKLKNMGVNI